MTLWRASCSANGDSRGKTKEKLDTVRSHIGAVPGAVLGVSRFVRVAVDEIQSFGEGTHLRLEDRGLYGSQHPHGQDERGGPATFLARRERRERGGGGDSEFVPAP